jgi:asparagine synthase (glutamine-hydrolysing)
VLLDGQGADEQLAGYRKFILVYLRQLASRGRYAKAAREAAAFAHPDVLRTSRLAHGRRYLLKAPDELAQLWPNGSLPERPGGMGIGKSLGDRIEADLTRFSLPVLLRYEDRNTMAFGVESRVPFVDHVLLEWLATLPADMRLSGGWTKRIMREALVGILPERIRTRKTKIGFETPQSRWLAGPLSSWLRDTLAAPRYLGEVVETGGVASLLDRYQSALRASPTLQNTLFRLAVYEAWAKTFLGARTMDERPRTKDHLAATASL